LKYDVIVLDAPWFFAQRPNGFNNGEQGKKTKFGGGAPGTYDLMTDERLLQTAPLIKQIAADDAVMFMWACWPRLEIAMEYMKACGFAYKTCAFNWIKTNKDGSPAYGPGAYTSSNSEPCLLGVKRKSKSGKFSLTPAKRMLNQIAETEEDLDGEDLFEMIFSGDVIKTPRFKHSQKPENVQDRIDLMYPTQRKLELFARRTRPGWTATGNQNDTNCMDIFDFLRKEIAENEQDG